MSKTTICVCGWVMFFGVVSAKAQGEGVRPHFITVNSSGKVKATPDVCVTVLEVRSSAPLAADALQQNEKRVSEVTAKLKELGINESDVHWAGNQFAPSGGGRIYMPGGQRPTGFEVYNVIEIRIKNPDVTNLDKFGARIASLLDELGKIGAGMLSPDLSRYSLGGSSAVVFALENFESYEKLVYEQAIERAKPIAEQLAKKLGVKLTGILSVSSNIFQASRPMGGYEIGYNYLASSPDDLAVRTNTTVSFEFK